MEFLDGVFTHLALVSNPRYERANIVLNSKTEFVTVGEGESQHAIPLKYIRAIIFGIAIRPLVISAIIHTAATVIYGPMNTAVI